MKKQLFKLNNKLKIIYNEEEYSSNIQDVTDEYIFISIPVLNNSYLSLKEDEEIEVVYYDDNELYEFFTVVAGREKKSMPLIILEQPTRLKKIQRRKFVRVNHFVDGFYKKVNLESINIKSKDEESEEGFKAISIIDLSGGGCRIKTEDKLSLNDTIKLRFFIEEESLNLFCKIIRVDRTQEGKYECGVLFLDITEQIREKIIRYIFELMRKQRKRGFKC
ncbi:flagellar brake protein [Haloimpatiens sp. FM7315]|uniref:flagellar brake protein n=1 Tax=Haloimpatiens sp. FM7315 TaxID=3298609 RepID=UPI00370C26B7